MILNDISGPSLIKCKPVTGFFQNNMLQAPISLHRLLRTICQHAVLRVFVLFLSSIPFIIKLIKDYIGRRTVSFNTTAFT